jgi:hypothetical protein
MVLQGRWRMIQGDAAKFTARGEEGARPLRTRWEERGLDSEEKGNGVVFCVQGPVTTNNACPALPGLKSLAR